MPSVKILQRNPTLGRVAEANLNIVSGFSNCVVLGSATATTNVSGNFIVPPNVDLLFVEVWGPGADTGSLTIIASPLFSQPGGPAGGYAAGFIAVTPGQVIPYFCAVSTATSEGPLDAANARFSWFKSQTELAAGSAAAVHNNAAETGLGEATGSGTLAKVIIKSPAGGKGQLSVALLGTTFFPTGGIGSTAPRGAPGGFGGAPAIGNLVTSGRPGGFPGGGAGGCSAGIATATTPVVKGGNGGIFVWY